MSPRVSASQKEQYVETRRNQIIDAAIEIFGNKGLDTATVDDVAQAAGISKGTIYIYFKSKDEIFDAILTERSTLPLIENLLEHAKTLKESGDSSLQSLLEKASYDFLNAIDEYYPLFHLLLIDSHRFPVQAEHVYNNLILKANQMFADFLSSEMEVGNIKNLESPLITARCFFGMLLIYVLSQEMLGGNNITPIKRSEWVKETVRLFLEGIQVIDK